jgi:hypothetical protein
MKKIEIFMEGWPFRLSCEKMSARGKMLPTPPKCSPCPLSRYSDLLTLSVMGSLYSYVPLTGTSHLGFLHAGSGSGKPTRQIFFTKEPERAKVSVRSVAHPPTGSFPANSNRVDCPRLRGREDMHDIAELQAGISLAEEGPDSEGFSDDY